MGERLVGLSHAVDVVLALVCAALLGLRVEQLVGEPLRHRLLATLAGELDEPAHREGASATLRDLDGHLVGGAADATGANLERRREDLQRRLEDLDRVLAAALGDDRQGVVDDLFGRGLLAVSITLLMTCWTRRERWIESGSIVRIWAAARRGMSYFFLTPYWERAFLRSLTPAASSVPRTTL